MRGQGAAVALHQGLPVRPRRLVAGRLPVLAVFARIGRICPFWPILAVLSVWAVLPVLADLAISAVWADLAVCACVCKRESVCE